MANTGILADGYFDLATDPDEGDFAQGLEDIVSLIKETPGGTLRRTTAIALASDAFAPVKDYCAHIIDTQSAAASDDLVTITSTGIRDGFIISISIANAARIITVKNSGNITTLDGLDLILNSTTFELWLRWDSTLGKWRQVTNPETTIRLNKIPGGLPSSALTISGGSVTATRGFHTITSESGVTDDLDLIAQTTLTQDTSLLYLKATTGHTITVRHNQVGTGKLMNTSGASEVLTGGRVLIYAKNGSQWDQVGSHGFALTTLIKSGGRLTGVAATPYPGDTSNCASLYLVSAGSDGSNHSTYQGGQWIVNVISGTVSVSPPNFKYCPFYVFSQADSGLAIEVSRWDGGSQTTGSITGVSIAAAAVITSNSHGLNIGDIVCIDSITGTVGTDAKAGLNSRANDVRQFVVTATTTNTFTIDAISTGLAYTSGGTWYKVPAAPALGTQDGIDVKSGDPTRRLVGGGMTGFTAGQCDQTQICAHVVSHLNPLYAPGQLSDGTNTPQSSSNSHTYNSTTARPFDNDHSKRVRWLTLTGRTEVKLFGYLSGANGASTYGTPSISLNRTDGSFFASGDVYDFAQSAPMRLPMSMIASSPRGSNFACVQEKCTAASNVTFASFTLSMSIPR